MRTGFKFTEVTAVADTPHDLSTPIRAIEKGTHIIGKLTDELLLHIENFEELYLEIRENRCVLLHLRPANYDDTVQLIEISKQLHAI